MKDVENASTATTGTAVSASRPQLQVLGQSTKTSSGTAAKRAFGLSQYPRRRHPSATAVAAIRTARGRSAVSVARATAFSQRTAKITSRQRTPRIAKAGGRNGRRRTSRELLAPVALRPRKARNQPIQ